MNKALKTILGFGTVGAVAYFLFPKIAAAAAGPATGADAVATLTNPDTSAPVKLYTVIAGESLSSIATKLYGDFKLWPVIWAATGLTAIPNPDVISQGLVLRVPEAPTDSATLQRIYGLVEKHRLWWVGGRKGPSPIMDFLNGQG